MLKRKFFLLISILFINFNIAAFEYNGSLVVSVVPEDLCEVTSFENDFLFLKDSSFRVGPVFDIGWSVSRYLKNGSDALIFGYSFGVGGKVQYRFTDNFCVDGDVKITAIYATFPTVLWGNVDFGATYYFNKNIFVRGMAGILFWDDILRFKGSGSCGIRL